MVTINVDDCAAVRNHVTLKAPLAAKLIHKQKVVGAGGLAVDVVVSAHDGAGFAFGNGSTKGRQVRIEFVVFADAHVRRVASRFRSTMYREMFGRRNGAIVFRIIALHAGDKGNPHGPCQERVFAVSLLAAAPARISKDIDIGGPEIKSLKKHAGAFLTDCLFMLDTSLDADDFGHLVNDRCIEGRSQANGLSKSRDSIVD